MNNGHECDNCGRSLSEDDYTAYGSWSYTCDGCGFTYNHSSRLTAEEQVEKFNDDLNSEEE